MSQNVIDLGHGISLIDLYDMGFENRTGCYVFREERVVLETGPSPIPHLLRRTENIEHRPRIHPVYYCHPHPFGSFRWRRPVVDPLPECTGRRPSPRRPPSIDPSRLIASAKVVYGEKFDQFFHPIVPSRKIASSPAATGIL